MITHSLRLSIACLVLTAVACGRPTDDMAPAAPPTGDGVTLDSVQRARIATTEAVEASFHPEIRTTGTVLFDGDHSTQVIAPIAGPVSTIRVALGAEVHAGEVLATVASPDYAQAIAEYRKSDAAWRNARRVADLNQKLLETGALPRAELEQSQSDLAEATADRDAARSTLLALGLGADALQALLHDSAGGAPAPAIRAPIGGTVVERLITPGQLLEAGTTPAFTIANLDRVWVDANVFGGDLAQVQVGNQATIVMPGSTDSLTGRVAFVGALVDPASRAAAVRIVVPNTGRVLRQNMLVTVLLKAGTAAEGVMVPVSAVLRDENSLPYLFVNLAPGRYLRRRVTLGARHADRYEIRSGVAAGELVVTDGSVYLSAVGAQ
ncbi:MAG TPA: efflux RND transporter periplasmic adaptor subunit [Gemmatimonadales bacterium]|nr:efflux RND transporter periplasmic adaptor subunit [Gemmatimonadales bacterium]